MPVAEADILAATDTPAAAPPQRAISAAGLLLSAAALGCALQVNFGQFHPLALLWLTVALVGGLLSIGRAGRRATRLPAPKVTVVLTLALGVQFLLLLQRSPGATGELAAAGSNLLPFRAGIIIAAALTAGACFAKGRLGRACLFAMLLTHAALGAWVLRAAPAPGIDVAIFQRDAAAALLAGQNPYAITFPNSYADPARYYAPGVVRDGRLMFGFPYPPLSLLLVLPGHWLGDFRYAQWAAMTLAGGLIALARPGRFATAAAAVLLFTPRGFFVLEAGWTEPFAVLLLAATVFIACRRPRALPAWLPLGLLVAVKQYLVLVLLLVPLLPASARMRRGRLLGFALAVAAAVTLPAALMDLPAFLHSAVVLQWRQPFRDDALSYLAGLAHFTGWRAPAWVGFALVAPAVLLCLRKCPRTPAGFAAAVALVCLVFFAFNKQAFCNYYHFVIGALCCAAGASGPIDPSPLPKPGANKFAPPETP